MLSVYVASPYANAPLVRELHETLTAHGMLVTSTWAEHAVGAEDFSRMSIAELRGVAAANDRDVRACDVVLLVDYEGKGRETYGELRVALEWGKAVIFVGRPNLSAWRRGVVRASDIDEALTMLVSMKAAHMLGRRGALLAEAVQ